MRQLKPTEVIQIVTYGQQSLPLIIDPHNNILSNQYILDKLHEQHPDVYFKLKNEMITESKLYEKEKQ